MGLYRGSAFKQFLIDRTAMGFDFEYIASEFETLYGLGLTRDEYDKTLKNCDDQIRQREDELKKEITKTSIYQQLISIREELEKAQDIALANDDLKSFSSLVNSKLKSLEVLIKAIDTTRKKENTNVLILQQNNYLALSQLEKDGIIEIKNPNIAKELFGVNDAKQLPGSDDD